jgi:hypothetical protein
MRNLAAAAALLIWAVGAARAGDPNTIFGRWIEKFPNGAGMVTDFTLQSMQSYSVDPAGKRLKDVGKFAVSYRNLGRSTIAIDFQGGGGVMVLVKDRDTIILDFPGMGAHTLKRLGTQP